jgi:hypothetical protein
MKRMCSCCCKLCGILNFCEVVDLDVVVHENADRVIGFNKEVVYVWTPVQRTQDVEET